MKLHWVCLTLASVPAALASASAATITLFAGGGPRVTGPAAECRLADPFAVEFDARGNAFLCEMTNHRVLRVDTRGRLLVVTHSDLDSEARDRRRAFRR